MYALYIKNSIDVKQNCHRCIFCIIKYDALLSPFYVYYAYIYNTGSLSLLMECFGSQEVCMDSHYGIPLPSV